MDSTRIIDTADPDQFVACGRPIADLTVTGRGRFRARIVRLDVEQTWGQRVRERLACVKQIELNRGALLFMIDPGPSMFLGGAEIGLDQVAVIPPGNGYNWRLSGATHWGAISPVRDDMDWLCGAEAALPARTLCDVSVFTPSPMALARLRSVHEYIGRLAETTPELLKNTELSLDLEHELISAAQELSRAKVSNFKTRGQRQHEIIVNRFRAIIETQADEPLDMSRISEGIGVSSRTLRFACQEQLGISPFQYVVLRRMRTVHRALQKADPQSTHVTDIATEHGFWEFGRFAGKYRQIFGEVPSATLKSAT